MPKNPAERYTPRNIEDMTALTVEEDRIGKVLVVSPTGRLDSGTAKDFDTLLAGRIAEGETSLLLDFTNLDYISSAGLRVVLLAGKRTGAGGGKTELCGLGSSIREVFEISGFLSIFKVYEDRAAATAALSA